MSGTTRKATRGSAVLLMIALLLSLAHTRPVHVWTVEDLAQKAGVLATGQVLAVTQVREVPADSTRWNIPLLEMRASVRVLRTLAQPGSPAPPQNSDIFLTYSAIDWEHCEGVVNGPQFPSLSVGEVFVFPLTPAKQPGAWQLIDEEEFGLLVPSIKVPLGGVGLETGVEFLRWELAGAFAKGTPAEIFRAAQYLRQTYRFTNLTAVYDLVRKHVADDQDRWLSIAAESYCAMGSPRPKIADLLKIADDPELKDNLAFLVAKALQHLPKQGLDDRLIAEFLKHADVHDWGTAMTISVNYPHHPTVKKILADMLKEGRLEAVYIAQFIIREKDDPLIPQAVEGARKVLLRTDLHDLGQLRPACQLVRDYGDDQTFSLLLKEFQKARTGDRKRYTAIFQSCAYDKSPRMASICRIAIDDTARLNKTYRFCDIAAFELQGLTGQDFGIKSEQTPAEREIAIQKAKAWLAANP